jgi:CopG family transcriptional regulator/antitoxin EndoAI
MHRRINITLPEETVRLIDRVAPKGDRSGLIALAITHCVEATGHARLRKLLKEGAIRRGDRDLRLAAEWFALDEETWPGARRRPRGEARSTSSTSSPRWVRRSRRRACIPRRPWCLGLVELQKERR